MNTGVRTEADAALALLGDYVNNQSVSLKTSAIIGLGLAYAGSHREDLISLLLPHVADDAAPMEISAFASLALGFIFVGSENGEIASTILQTLMERDDNALDEKWGRFMALGLGLLYLGLKLSVFFRIFPDARCPRFTGLQDSDAKDATIELLKAIEHPISKTAQVLVEVCSFAGSGNVLKVQTMLHHCDEHIDMSKDKDKAKENKENPESMESTEPKQDDTFQAFAVLGIALVAMGEDIGAEMSMRQFNHLACPFLSSFSSTC